MRVIDESTIRQLMATPSLARDFSFLRRPATVKKKPCCGASGGASQKVDYNRIKASIGALPVTTQRRLLSTIGLTQGRLIYRSGSTVVDKVIG
jgi:hypothetical protein